jgi:hypothetical protein
MRVESKTSNGGYDAERPVAESRIRDVWADVDRQIAQGQDRVRQLEGLREWERMR